MSLPNPVRATARPPADSGQCERSFELFGGPAGPLHIGRLLKGHEAGRLVFLRRAPSTDPSGALAQAVDSARCIAHPSLGKVLGIVWTDGTPHVASEYVAGASLVELQKALLESGAPLEAKVAIRIIIDALQAAKEAEGLLRSVGTTGALRCIFADTVWIAEFGATFLTEVGVAMLLNPETRELAGVEASSDGEAVPLEMSETRAAALALYQLLTNRPYEQGAPEPFATLPPALVPVLARALSPDPATTYATPAQLAQALSELPAELQADESDVATLLHDSMRALLKVQRHKLSLFERLSAVVADHNGATQFYRGSSESAERRKTEPPGVGHNELTLVMSAVSRSKPPVSERTRALSIPPADDSTSRFTVNELRARLAEEQKEETTEPKLSVTVPAVAAAAPSLSAPARVAWAAQSSLRAWLALGVAALVVGLMAVQFLGEHEGPPSSAGSLAPTTPAR